MALMASMRTGLTSSSKPRMRSIMAIACSGDWKRLRSRRTGSSAMATALVVYDPVETAREPPHAAGCFGESVSSTNLFCAGTQECSRSA